VKPPLNLKGIPSTQNSHVGDVPRLEQITNRATNQPFTGVRLITSHDLKLGRGEVLNIRHLEVGIRGHYGLPFDQNTADQKPFGDPSLFRQTWFGGNAA
jgi:hypothetical protein